jgi:pyruvate formate lyase activating enzyme
METSGLGSWDLFEQTLADVDLLLYDLKTMDPEQHRTFTEVSNEGILDNLKRVVARGVPTIIRVPVVPGINDGEENYRTMGRFLSVLGSVRQVDLLPYHRLGEAMYARLGRQYSLAGTPLPSEATLERLAGILQGIGLQVQIGG